MIGYDEVASTVSFMDAQAEAMGLEAMLRERGIDVEGLFRAAEQRALRIAMIISGQDPTVLARDRFSRIDLDEETRKLLTPLQLAFIDGFVAGRAASDPADRIQRFPERGDT
jgi:hypothetical protein